MLYTPNIKFVLTFLYANNKNNNCRFVIKFVYNYHLVKMKNDYFQQFRWTSLQIMVH